MLVFNIRVNVYYTVRPIKDVANMARYFDLPRDVAERRVPELLEFIQLSERANANVEPLSGGMKRRLSLAATGAACCT